MPLYIQNIEVAGFDWDSGNLAKCQKHGMSLVEIEQIFANIVQLAADEAHSHSEPRQLAVGRTLADRHAFVVFTIRQTDQGAFIRPLSARYMHAKEFKRYDR